MDAALAGHYRAFEHFLEARDLMRAQQALKYLLSICMDLGRFDEVMSAAEKLAPLLEEAGDPADAASNYARLGHVVARVRPMQDRVEFMEKACRIVDHAIRDDANAVPAYVRLAVELEATNAYITRISLKRSPEESRKAAKRHLEVARSIADGLKDDSAKAGVLWHEGALCETTGDFAGAESAARKALNLQIGPYLQMRMRAVLGAALMKQGRNEEAIEVLESSLASRDEETDFINVAQERFRLGMAHFRVNHFVQALEVFGAAADAFESGRGRLHEQGRVEMRALMNETYDILIHVSTPPLGSDPLAGWTWLQRGRGRALNEALGLAPLRTPSVPEEDAPLLNREGEALSRLRTVRSSLASISDFSPERLDLEFKDRKLMTELQEIWKKLAVVAPEYAELRSGSPPEWADIREMLDREEAQVS
jgi:tetratricopeptide (TPR) repeat protein